MDRGDNVNRAKQIAVMTASCLLAATPAAFAQGNSFPEKDKIIAALETAVAAREELRRKQEQLEMQKIAATIATAKRDLTVFRTPVRFRPA